MSMLLADVFLDIHCKGHQCDSDVGEITAPCRQGDSRLFCGHRILTISTGEDVGSYKRLRASSFGFREMSLSLNPQLETRNSELISSARSSFHASRTAVATAVRESLVPAVSDSQP